LKKGSKSHPILSSEEQPLQGIYLKENWKKRQPMANYDCHVGRTINPVGWR
jgi:hypothetical protein